MDSRPIQTAIEANLVSVREATVALLGNPALTTKKIVHHLVDSVIVDNAYLVVYEVGTPWYADKECLHELMVLKIGDGSSFQAVTDLLDDLAWEFDVTLTVVGTAFSRAPKALARLYSRHGYVTEGKPSLTKRR